MGGSHGSTLGGGMVRHREPASQADDEGDLVMRAQHGDDAAYGQLVSIHQAVAFRTAYLITGDRDEAEDCAQQGFIKAHRALARFRLGSPFRPWLLRIVANEARNSRRSAGARSRLSLRIAPPAAGDPSPEEHAIAEERRARLLEALARAPVDDRVVIAYRYFLGLSEAEMVVALDRPAGTVKSRLSRALGRLRDDLTGPPAGEPEP